MLPVFASTLCAHSAADTVLVQCALSVMDMSWDIDYSYYVGTNWCLKVGDELLLNACADLRAARVVSV